MKNISALVSLSFAMLLPACTSIVALRTDGVVPLNDGWTADGRPVSLPHCWNVEDGTNGPVETNCWSHDSVGGKGYERKSVLYARELPQATPWKNRYLRVHATSIHAVVRVDGNEIGRGTHPTERAFYRAFRDFDPLNDLGIG